MSSSVPLCTFSIHLLRPDSCKQQTPASLPCHNLFYVNTNLLLAKNSNFAPVKLYVPPLPLHFCYHIYIVSINSVIPGYKYCSKHTYSWIWVTVWCHSLLVWRISFGTSLGRPLAMNHLTMNHLCLCGNVSISPSFQKDSFAGYRSFKDGFPGNWILHWRCLVCILNMSFHCFLDSVVSHEKSAISSTFVSTST